MNVLIVGVGTAGSWQIRGVQLGAALGARVTTTPTAADWAWADRIVLVKRALSTWGVHARRTGAPVVWDAVDFWGQPEQNHYSRDAALAMARAYMAPVSPDLVIGATQAMAEDLGGVYLPHHAAPSLTPRPVRATVELVAYEGNPQYLGRWLARLMTACAARGWQFVVNPGDLSQADIVVALRAGAWDGWMCRAWKSGVKLVNAIAVGRPVICQDTAAARELQPCGARLEADTDEHLQRALDVLAEQTMRDRSHAWACRQREAYTLDAVAAQYRQILEQVPCPA